jgi:hypothetical protein
MRLAILLAVLCATPAMAYPLLTPASQHRQHMIAAAFELATTIMLYRDDPENPELASRCADVALIRMRLDELDK